MHSVLKQHYSISEVCRSLSVTAGRVVAGLEKALTSSTLGHWVFAATAAVGYSSLTAHSPFGCRAASSAQGKDKVS